MQTSIYRPRTNAVWADASFASALQRSDQPSAGQVRTAIADGRNAHCQVCDQQYSAA